MKKKGFTLIELLAVIVILAIIALIITPLISDLIESSRFASAVDSALAYVSGANSQVAADVGIGGFEDFSLHLPEENELETGITDDELAKIKYKGKGPTYVYLHFSDDGKIVDEGRFCIWGYSIDYNNIDGASKGAVDYCSDPEPDNHDSGPSDFKAQRVRCQQQHLGCNNHRTGGGREGHLLPSSRVQHQGDPELLTGDTQAYGHSGRVLASCAQHQHRT